MDHADLRTVRSSHLFRTYSNLISNSCSILLLPMPKTSEFGVSSDT